MVAIGLNEVDTLISYQEMKISFYSSWLGYIERSTNINFQEIISDRIWIHERNFRINHDYKFWSTQALSGTYRALVKSYTRTWIYFKLGQIIQNESLVQIIVSGNWIHQSLYSGALGVKGTKRLGPVSYQAYHLKW